MGKNVKEERGAVWIVPIVNIVVVTGLILARLAVCMPTGNSVTRILLAAVVLPPVLDQTVDTNNANHSKSNDPRKYPEGAPTKERERKNKLHT